MAQVVPQPGADDSSSGKPRYQRIYVIINPAAGQDRPVLGIINRVLQRAHVDWEVRVTKKAGDAQRFVREAMAVGVDAVAVCGGDGTVAEVASALVETQVPMAIFPGGTANVMCAELGIPGDLAAACALVGDAPSTTRLIDVGTVGGRTFLLRIGVGFEADMVEGADRDLKNRLGVLAYAIAGIYALVDPKIARYRLTLDGRQVETDGVTCMIANAGGIGHAGFTLAPTIDVGDGLLDVLVVRKADLPSLLAVATGMTTSDEASSPFQHWQVREVSVEADPRQTVQCDGEVLGQTPVSARVVPQAVNVIVPVIA